MANLWAGLVGIVAELGTPGWIALAAALMLAAPLADRLVIRRKRIDYRVLYNSKIGLDPLSRHDELSSEADPRLRHLTDMANRMSVVIIRIRNVGSYDIEKRDYDLPLSFTFGKRVVWDARISEASTPELRAAARANLAFFTEDTAPRRPAPGDSGDLGAVRTWLRSRMSTTIEAGATELGPQWHGVRVGQLALKRREKFKLVVVLQEPDDRSGGETTKTVLADGRIENGWIRDEKTKPRFTGAAVATGLSLLLAGALIATSIHAAVSAEPDHCASGSIQIAGSSAFMPVVDRVAEQYEKDCDGATISTSDTGSIDGLGLLGRDAGSPVVGVFSDGPADHGDFQQRPIAVVTFAVVVNSETDVPGLTSDDLRAIFSGEVTDWSQVGGAPGPIKIVDRTDLSGTRKVFENEVIKGDITAPTLPCDSHVLAPDGPPVRCWSPNTAAVLNRVETTPGAIGFADVHAARTVAEARALAIVPLDGKDPGKDGYPFWAVEYLYTRKSEDDPLLTRFQEYLTGDPARALLIGAETTPCGNPSQKPCPDR
ncbi:substrate-binding domain-containing protein [Saccharopolyspora sp. TS4A08]|uniref:Substrate-binding domain-containing protein n=1 Tax=Saccharopolyspora ipomoeae TaxID=3042027 RepID=A0ABT6PT46_9PSEU|nr:substrate-binding domain-containing protein [Saccharopolyspora sp. TS4A08]MDI2031153.1 substrate-binding domain-containing protein [Saccharopolyspora sp. TS4A08]